MSGGMTGAIMRLSGLSHDTIVTTLAAVNAVNVAWGADRRRGRTAYRATNQFHAASLRVADVAAKAVAGRA